MYDIRTERRGPYTGQRTQIHHHEEVSPQQTHNNAYWEGPEAIVDNVRFSIVGHMVTVCVVSE